MIKKEGCSLLIISLTPLGAPPNLETVKDHQMGISFCISPLSTVVFAKLAWMMVRCTTLLPCLLTWRPMAECC